MLIECGGILEKKMIGEIFNRIRWKLKKNMIGEKFSLEILTGLPIKSYFCSVVEDNDL